VILQAAMPVIAGRKSKIESFAGANITYTIEAMMGDKRALQVLHLLLGFCMMHLSCMHVPALPRCQSYVEGFRASTASTASASAASASTASALMQLDCLLAAAWCHLGIQ